MNIVFTPSGWEERIREGELSAQLLRPLHPLHYDLAYFAGWKVVVIVLWLPIAVVLALRLPPDARPDAARQCVAFAIAIWGAYLIRTMLQWALGLVTFWTTRGGPIFELYITAELLLSGRLVPLALMPDGSQDARRTSCRSSGRSASRSRRSSATCSTTGARSAAWRPSCSGSLIGAVVVRRRVARSRDPPLHARSAG